MALNSHHHLILLSFLSLALHCTIPAQALANGTTSAQILHAHNTARKAVGVPPLKWNSTLSEMAMALAREVRNQNRCTKPPFPLNSWYNMLSSTAEYKEPVVVTMRRWVALRKHYKYAENECDDKGWSKCDVYLQIVQREVAEVGCSWASCGRNRRTGRIVVCLYYPPGNFTGLRPY